MCGVLSPSPLSQTPIISGERGWGEVILLKVFNIYSDNNKLNIPCNHEIFDYKILLLRNH
jgi:hypothetical protein